MEVALERFGRGEPLENVQPLRRRVLGARTDRLDPLLDEALGRRVRDVHVLGAERPRVRVLERRDDFAKPHPLRAGLERADVEFGIEIRFAEAVRLQVEVGHVRRLEAQQGIEIGVVHAERAELADEPQHEHLLVHRRRVDHRAGDLFVLRELDERRDHRRMRDIVGIPAELVEICAPLGLHARRIGEVTLVEVLDERRVAAEQRAGRLEFGHAAHGVTSCSRSLLSLSGAAHRALQFGRTRIIASRSAGRCAPSHR